jgi:predicted PurR-regulated permease PerM
VICVLAALLTTDLWPTTVVVAIFFVAYQQLENYLIAPRILRHTVSMSAAAVLLAALIGGTILGLVGALMAIPIAAALKVVLAEQLHARDTADTSTALPHGGEAAVEPGTTDEAAPSPAIGNTDRAE